MGPQPGREAPATIREYIGGLLPGSLSIIELPKDREDLEKQLKRYTARTLACRPPAPPVPYTVTDHSRGHTCRRSRACAGGSDALGADCLAHESRGLSHVL
jgi:hypothetical protein